MYMHNMATDMKAHMQSAKIAAALLISKHNAINTVPTAKRKDDARATMVTS